MSNNGQLSFDQVLTLYEGFKAVGEKAELLNSEIEFHFPDSQKKDKIEKIFKDTGLITSSYSNKSFSVTNINCNFIFFDNLESLFDKVNLNPLIVDTLDIFVFDENGHYYYHNPTSQEVKSNLPSTHNKSILKHFLQYNNLLKIFIEQKGRLVEVEKNTASGKELIVLSKGEDKLITSISYLSIDRDIFQQSYSEFHIDRFKTKLTIDEWLACFKSTLCQFMELQSDDRRNFGNLYTNFNYIFNQTSKNYDLYISKFSFEKIRKQFKIEKNSYFDSLNTAQDKISGQIISVPISLGASIYSFYQFNSSLFILAIIYVAICIYSLFIGFVVVMNLYDIKKVAVDVNEERENMKSHFDDLYKELKKDFDYMENKRKRVRILAWSIIIALIITLLSITIFLFNYHQPNGHRLKFLYI